MSITIKGITYDTTKNNLDLTWSKYNGTPGLTGNGSSDGSGGTAAALNNRNITDIANSYPTYRVADYISGAAYPVNVWSVRGYGLGWYPLAVLPTAKVTVNFDNNGGSKTFTWDTSGDNTAATGGSFPSVTKTGYTHTGWKIDGTTYSKNYTPTNKWVADRWSSGAKAATAVFTAGTYIVSFDANGGSNAPSSQTKTYGETLTLTSAKPTRAGYTFMGWAKTPTGEVEWQAGGAYTDNVTRSLYAIWQSNTVCTITYDTNGGGTIASQSGYNGTSLTLSSTIPAKSNAQYTVTLTYDKAEEDATISKSSDTVTLTRAYTFVSWNTKADGTGTSYQAGQQISLTESMTLYAQYSGKASGTVELPTGTLDQYVLQGWSKSQTDINILPSTYSPTQSETLYAIWAVNGLGGMLKIPGELTLNEGDTIRLVGTKGHANDRTYTVASSSVSGGVTTIYLNEDFPETIAQDASQYPMEIYGAGTYVPDFDFICAKDNRLWGCSNATRTIYASAQGFPDEFFDLDTLATSSWDLVVATPGDFTGCVAMNSGIMFSKQHYIHKVLGSIPAEFSLYTYNTDGASYTNGLSLVNADGTTMYVGEHGVMMYNGSQSGTFSLELGENQFQSSRGCFDGEKYFVSSRMGDTPVCYEYDSRYGMWIQRDFGGYVESAVHLRDKNYVLVDGRIYMTNSGLETEDTWEILFKPFIETIDGLRNTSQQFFQKKRYAHLRFRIQLPETSTFVAEVRADGYGWLKVADMHGINDKVIEFPVFTPRCDKLQLRLSGQGKMTLLGIEREYMVGSAR